MHKGELTFYDSLAFDDNKRDRERIFNHMQIGLLQFGIRV